MRPTRRAIGRSQVVGQVLAPSLRGCLSYVGCAGATYSLTNGKATGLDRGATTEAVQQRRLREGIRLVVCVGWRHDAGPLRVCDQRNDHAGRWRVYLRGDASSGCVRASWSVFYRCAARSEPLLLTIDIPPIARLLSVGFSWTKCQRSTAVSPPANWPNPHPYVPGRRSDRHSRCVRSITVAVLNGGRGSEAEPGGTGQRPTACIVAQGGKGR